MRIRLIAEKYIDNAPGHNFAQMTKGLKKCEGQGFDLLCFGESFAHVFEALAWEHARDLKISLCKNDPRIAALREEARKATTGFAFGRTRVIDGRSLIVPRTKAAKKRGLPRFF